MKDSTRVFLLAIGSTSETIERLRKPSARKRKVVLYLPHVEGAEPLLLVGPELNDRGEGYSHHALVQLIEGQRLYGRVIGAGTLLIHLAPGWRGQILGWRIATLAGGSKFYDDLVAEHLDEATRKAIAKDLKAKVAF